MRAFLRLECAGFRWTLRLTFNERFEELIIFRVRVKCGHCNVSKKEADVAYRPLGVRCRKLRYIYKQIQNRVTPSNSVSLSDENVRRLEEVFFFSGACVTDSSMGISQRRFH